MISILFVVVSVVLSSMSSRFIFGGDSAEFSAIAHTWSIPHPPGYPLYSFLLNCLTHTIPFGSIPWRSSLLSVIPTVLTSYILFRILTKLHVRMWISLLVALLYIILFPVWTYSLVPEVFALNSFLVIATTYALFCHQHTKGSGYLLLSAFLVGLNVAHHHIFLIFVPGWIVLLKDTFPLIMKSGKIRLHLLVCFIFGVSFYLYAPIASYFNPPIQWEDSKTLIGFWRLITRAMYGTFTAYGGSKGNIVNQLYDIFSLFLLIFQDFRIIGTFLIGVGVWTTHRNKSNFSRFLAVTSLAHIFFFFYTNFILLSPFSIGMYERFLISFYSILILYLGRGFEYLYSRAVTLVYRYSDKESIRIGAKICLMLFLIIYISTVANTNYKSLSYIQNGKDFDRLGKDIIDTVPTGSVFFAGNDNANFTTLYQVFEAKYNTKSIFFQINFINQKHYVEQFKKNNPALIFPAPIQGKMNLQKFISLNRNSGIYLETPQPYGFWMPYGLLWKYYESQKEALADLSSLVKANTYLWNTVYHIPELNDNTRNILHLQSIQDFYSESYITYAKLLYFAKEETLAQEVMKQLLKKYRPSNNHAKLTLMNLILLEKKCGQAEKIAQEILLLPVESLETEFVPPLVKYYSLCDPSNSRLPLLKRAIEQNKNKLLTPLDSF